MERQPYCSWCGATGKIDMHHVIPRSQGGSDDSDNLVALCHSCHMKHHGEGGKRLAIFNRGGDLWGCCGNDERPLSIYDECRDTIPIETEDVLGTLAADLRELKCSADQIDYFLSRELAEAESRLGGDRKALAEWCVDNLEISPRSVDSYLSKRIAYASLPEEASTLGISKGYLVYRLLEKHPFDEVLHDIITMPRAAFDAAYGLVKKKDKHDCPECGASHTRIARATTTEGD